MEQLIAELEKETGGHRELDYKIALSITGGLKPGATLEQYMEYVDVPPYSQSIDAALALVPEGWHWSVNDGSDQYPQNVADIFKTGFGGTQNMRYKGPFRHKSYAKTPALAICIAALKARCITLSSPRMQGRR